MTTPYGVSTNIGSSSYSGYLNASITGPLSTNNYPSARPYSMYGTLPGKSTPQFFYSQNEPVNAEMITNARHQYLRTSVNKQTAIQQIAEAKTSKPLAYHINGYNTYKAVSQHMNYINPISSSQYVNIIKANAVGQSGYKVNLQNYVPISTKNYYPSGTRSSVRRARSGGCTAPKKKGAIENYSLRNGQTCGWGSIVRSTY
jgi:type II secretory pathway pseudopilin PulG